MTIVSIRENYDGRTASVDNTGTVKLQRVFQVETDNKDNDQVYVLAGLKYPDATNPYTIGSTPVKVYDAHPSYASAKLTNVQCQPETPMLWKVTLDYSTGQLPARTTLSSLTSTISDTSPPGPSNDPSTGNSNSRPAPSRPPEVSIGTREYTVADDAFFNTLGEQLTGVERTVSNLVIQIKYWTLNQTLATLAARRNKVNNATWNGFPKGSLLVKDIQLACKYDIVNNIAGTDIYGEVRECTISLEYQPSVALTGSQTREGWETAVLNVGTKRKVGGTGDPIPFTGGDGTPLDARPLKSNGDLATSTSDWYYIIGMRYDYLDFTTLMI